MVEYHGIDSILISEPSYLPLSSLSAFSVRIFLSGSKSSPDMAFWLIYIKHMSGLLLMYGALWHAECLGGLPHCGIGFNDIVGDMDCPLLDIILQKNTPQESFLQCMRDSWGVWLFGFIFFLPLTGQEICNLFFAINNISGVLTLSSRANAQKIVNTNSLLPILVMLAVRNYVSIPSAFSLRTLCNKSTVFLANREISFTTTISNKPFSASASIRWNSLRFLILVPEIPSSAYNLIRLSPVRFVYSIRTLSESLSYWAGLLHPWKLGSMLLCSYWLAFLLEFLHSVTTISVL